MIYYYCQRREIEEKREVQDKREVERGENEEEREGEREANRGKERCTHIHTTSEESILEKTG